MDIPQTSIHMSDGIFINQVKLEKRGTLVQQHQHPYSHSSFVARGILRVYCSMKWLGDFKEGEAVLIEASKPHSMISLEDNTIFYCIHNTDRIPVELLEEEIKEA